MKSHVYRISANSYRDLCRAIDWIEDGASSICEARRRVRMDERLFYAQRAIFKHGKTSTILRIPDGLAIRIVDAFFPTPDHSPFFTREGLILLIHMVDHTYPERLARWANALNR